MIKYDVLDLRNGIVGDRWTVYSTSAVGALRYLGYEGIMENPKGKIHVSSDEGSQTFSARHQNERGWMSEKNEY